MTELERVKEEIEQKMQRAKDDKMSFAFIQGMQSVLDVVNYHILKNKKYYDMLNDADVPGTGYQPTGSGDNPCDENTKPPRCGSCQTDD